MIRYTVGFMFDDRLEKVLLIEKIKPEWQKGFLNGVGGKLKDVDSSMLHCMIREFKEETRINYTDWNHYVTIVKSDIYEVAFYYAVNDIVEYYSQQEEEKLYLIDTAKICRQKTVYNLQWLIPLALDNCVKFPLYIEDTDGS